MRGIVLSSGGLRSLTCSSMTRKFCYPVLRGKARRYRNRPFAQICMGSQAQQGPETERLRAWACSSTPPRVPAPPRPKSVLCKNCLSKQTPRRHLCGNCQARRFTFPAQLTIPDTKLVRSPKHPQSSPAFGDVRAFGKFPAAPCTFVIRPEAVKQPLRRPEEQKLNAARTQKREGTRSPGQPSSSGHGAGKALPALGLPALLGKDGETGNVYSS